MIEGAGQVKAEVVGGAQDAVGGGAGFDGQHAAQDILLPVFGDHVVEDGEDVGLLAEDLSGRVCRQSGRGGVPAFFIEAGANVAGAVR